MECLFCKIVAKKIPNHTVYEDNYTLAFLDIFPCAKGHTIVIPKEHYATIWEMNIENFERLANGLRAAAGRIEARLRPDGMNIGINNGEAAGQAVPHVHWHIIPRYQDDGGGSMHSIIKNPGSEDVNTMAALFR